MKGEEMRFCTVLTLVLQSSGIADHSYIMICYQRYLFDFRIDSALYVLTCPLQRQVETDYISIIID